MIETAKKKGKKKPKSDRSAFMKALMTSFAKHEPETISSLFVKKNTKKFNLAFKKVFDDLIKQAMPEDEKDQTSVTARVIKVSIKGK